MEFFNFEIINFVFFFINCIDKFILRRVIYICLDVVNSNYFLYVFYFMSIFVYFILFCLGFDIWEFFF